MRTVKDWLDYFDVKTTEQIKDTDTFKKIVENLGGASGYFFTKGPNGYELCIISGNKLSFYDGCVGPGGYLYPCGASLFIKIDN